MTEEATHESAMGFAAMGSFAGARRDAPPGERSDIVKTRVFVTLKPSVFDPQGKTIVDALQSMGYAAVHEVRQGKYFELDVDVGSVDEARSVAGEVADKLLANPVIESYRVEVDDEAGGQDRQ